MMKLVFVLYFFYIQEVSSIWNQSCQNKPHPLRGIHIPCICNQELEKPVEAFELGWCISLTPVVFDKYIIYIWLEKGLPAHLLHTWVVSGHIQNKTGQYLAIFHVVSAFLPNFRGKTLISSIWCEALHHPEWARTLDIYKVGPVCEVRFRFSSGSRQILNVCVLHVSNDMF